MLLYVIQGDSLKSMSTAAETDLPIVKDMATIILQPWRRHGREWR